MHYLLLLVLFLSNSVSAFQAITNSKIIQHKPPRGTWTTTDLRMVGTGMFNPSARKKVAVPVKPKSTVSPKAVTPKNPKKSSADPSGNFKKSELVAAVALATGLNKKESEMAIVATFEAIKNEVGTKGKRFSYPGFGVFTLKESKARKGRNPQTGEDLMIPAAKRPGFSVSKAWKDELNEKK